MANISQQTSGLCDCKLKKSAKRILLSPNPMHSITNHNILKSKASDYLESSAKYIDPKILTRIMHPNQTKSALAQNLD
jgi:hypothetical protein